MKTLPADLEALMPEPFGYVPFPGEFYPPNELDAEVKNDWATVAVFTADQVREAIRGATERAEKMAYINALDKAYDAMFDLKGDKVTRFDAQTAIRKLKDASAIRSGGEAGS